MNNQYHVETLGHDNREGDMHRCVDGADLDGQLALQFMETAARMLNMGSAERRAMLAAFSRQHGLPDGLLPDPVADLPPVGALVGEPVAVGSPALAPTLSTRCALSRYNMPLDDDHFHALLVDVGVATLAEPADADPTSGLQVVIAPAYRCYGFNATPPDRPQVSYPRWYAHSFGALLAMLGLGLVAA